MESIDHFSHQHPLVLVDQEPGDQGSRKGFCSGCNQAVLEGYCYRCRKVAEGYCSGCEEELEGSSYGCGECGFFLHKKCAELQTDIINHPLHSEHPLTLRLNRYAFNGCNVCSKSITFFYRCDSCDFDLDLRCAMHPQFVAQEFQKLQHFSHDHPLMLVEDIEFQTKEGVCSGCREPMYKSSPFYCCPNCVFYLHKKCAELPLKVNHPAHRKHPLKLLAKPPAHREKCSCHLCTKSYEGFVYYCSVCEFDFRAADAFLHTITAEIHEHSLTPFSGTISFVCNACGTDGNHACFTCVECNLIFHSDCTSLRRTIKIIRHPHRLSHIYFVQDEEEAGKRECNICHDDINLGYGSYCCSDCKYFAHVNCAIDEDLLEDEESKLSDDLIAISPAFQQIKPGEIKHFSHKHNLILGGVVKDGRSCEGCMRSIPTSFYSCAQCNFFLCKCCVHGLPKKVRHWTCKHLRELFFYSIFHCRYCWFWSSGFGYNCNACNRIMCIQCHEILDTRIVNIEGQEHFLFFDHKYEGKCNGCDDYRYQRSFRCKDKKCNFALDYRCLVLPETARYKYDYHALKLTYRDDNDLSQCYCDICEKTRDPKLWFYHCANCDISAHPNCVLWKSPFVKLGKPFRIDDHEHPVTLVKIDFYPPKCNECGKPCRDDLSIQCTEPDCTYIFHWDCYREHKFPWVRTFPRVLCLLHRD
ncbi:hypothetical protein SLEP1_g58077 [Rubroshorea leprosula]|uniref:Zinc finger PHD-type domain-containing protein n=1 Tax=Rubroshorea leprosula TaxID=152421 RepID=A0AAV5MNE7_9ROSI|nr:hypothetical protein SLEP1_g58077 [Rubroshorea leprosula]